MPLAVEWGNGLLPGRFQPSVMKENEIEPRQNRAIYTLMVVVAIVALGFAIWYHTRA